jgi:hypothetical protein
MPLIDERGRLFGKLNLIDALAGAFVLLVIPLAYGAVALFRMPPPTIATVQPAAVAEHATETLRLTGTDLRPFLRARIGSVEAPFFVQTPTLAEIKLPDLTAGTYDVALYDEGHELVRMPNALVVGSALDVAVSGTATLRIKLVATAEVLDAVRAGDRDMTASAGGGAPDGSAELLDVSSRREPVTGRGTLGDYEVTQQLFVALATVRAPVVQKTVGWMYRDRPVRIGVPFRFNALNAYVSGTIVGMTVVPDAQDAAR